MNKIIILSILWFAFTTGLQAQPAVIEKALAVPANKKIDLQLKFANNIKITAWNRNEASVRITYELNSGKLNNAFKYSDTSDDAGIHIKTDLDHELMKTGKAEDCPNINQWHFSTDGNGNRTYTCSEINYEIFVPRDTDLTVETINGNIILHGITGPVHAKSISGFVDMDWPSRKGASVALKTITGEIFSDFDIAFNKGKRASIAVGANFKGSMSGGGTALSLESRNKNNNLNY